MYSDSITSIIEPRIIRETYGVTAKINVRDGKTKDIGSAQANVPGSTKEIAGKIWKMLVASRNTTKIATTNSGRDASMSVTSELTLSKIFPRRTAAYVPIAIDNGIAIIPEDAIRISVF
jgi:hypothetical protein